MQSLEAAADACNKHWKRVRYKVESESFGDRHACEWKLGVAHEGTYPGRKRIVIRPRRMDKTSKPAKARENRERSKESYSSSSSPSKAQSNTVSSKYPSNADTTVGIGTTTTGTTTTAANNTASTAGTTTNTAGDTKNEKDINDMNDINDINGITGITDITGDAGNAKVKELGRKMREFIIEGGVDGDGDGQILAQSSSLAEESWGIVGEDGSEDGGFGVVGVARVGKKEKEKEKEKQELLKKETKASLAERGVNDNGQGEIDNASETETETEYEAEEGVNDSEVGGGLFDASLLNDVNGDVVEMADAELHGRIVETGPAHAGTRRWGSGATVFEAPVILVTASGNVHGTLSFNEKEVFFSSMWITELWAMFSLELWLAISLLCCCAYSISRGALGSHTDVFLAYSIITIALHNT